ncbi:MAG: HlyD family type I secretion periplasmic adaptor subunit [Magnetococcales bacterium]|nr:HlyD family type I secretion periplasmic adaptor subunit [Magnetococcales bacterium]
MKTESEKNAPSVESGLRQDSEHRENDAKHGMAIRLGQKKSAPTEEKQPRQPVPVRPRTLSMKVGRSAPPENRQPLTREPERKSIVIPKKEDRPDSGSRDSSEARRPVTISRPRDNPPAPAVRTRQRTTRRMQPVTSRETTAKPAPVPEGPTLPPSPSSPPGKTISAKASPSRSPEPALVPARPSPPRSDPPSAKPALIAPADPAVLLALANPPTPSPVTVAPHAVVPSASAPPPSSPPMAPPPAPAVVAAPANGGNSGSSVQKTEEKPDWLTMTRQEPESLQSLLEPEPEEITRLKQGYKQHRFMAQSVILEESGLSLQVRSAMLAVSLVIVAFFVWASFSTMDEIASTMGQVMPSSPAQQIQHLEGGIIREILVQEGQVIKEGAIIVRLDTEAVLADLNQLNAKKASLKAQEIRIRAFLSDTAADFSPIAPHHQSLVLGQNHLLLAQRSALASERGVLETRISRSRSRIENLLEQQKNIDVQKTYFSQELEMKRQGFEKGVVSKLNYLTIQKDLGRTEAEWVRVRGDLTTAKKELEEAVGDLDEVLKKSRETNLRELGTVSTELAQVEEQSRRLVDRANRLEIRSPVWGVVNNLQVKTVGGVIAPGALIAEIIPMDTTRRVETKISTRDIGHVAVGQSVTVKVTTYDFARYGGINGILESISPTTFKEPEEKEPFYKGIVRLEKPYVGFNDRKNPVLPGMTVQADIDTGSKTLMEYMLKPIYASINKAFRER